jgi:anti-sigma regulatory factor (Ser/Thr protein kinase)
MNGVITIHPGPAPRPGTLLLERTWPSRLDLKHEPLDAVADLLVGKGMVVEDDRPWLALCLDEALVNAMLHGNEGDPALTVTVAAFAGETAWTVVIGDQGGGFAPAQIPDADDPEALLREHGRGIRIMREWLDELAYYRGGATVLMSRRRADR